MAYKLTSVENFPLFQQTGNIFSILLILHRHIKTVSFGYVLFTQDYFLFPLRRLVMNNERTENATHHAKCVDVIGICTGDETFRECSRGRAVT